LLADDTSKSVRMLGYYQDESECDLRSGTALDVDDDFESVTCRKVEEWEIKKRDLSSSV